MITKAAIARFNGGPIDWSWHNALMVGMEIAFSFERSTVPRDVLQGIAAAGEDAGAMGDNRDQECSDEPDGSPGDRCPRPFRLA